MSDTEPDNTDARIAALEAQVADLVATCALMKSTPPYLAAEFAARRAAGVARVRDAVAAAKSGDFAALAMLDGHEIAEVASSASAVELITSDACPSDLRDLLAARVPPATRLEMSVRARVAAGNYTRYERLTPAPGCSLLAHARTIDEANANKMIDAKLGRFVGIDAYRRAHAISIGWAVDDGSSWVLPVGSAALIASVDMPFANEMRAGRVRVEPCDDATNLRELRLEVADAGGARYAPTHVVAWHSHGTTPPAAK